MSSQTSHQGRRELPGSHRNPVAGARHIGPVNPKEVIEVSLYLRDPAGQIAPEGGIPPRLSREEYASQHSAAPADIDQVKQFALAHGLTVVEVDPVSRRIKLAGPVNAITSAFGTDLQLYEHGGETFRGRTGPLSVPANLIGVVTSVLGLDNRPQARIHLRYYDPAVHPHATSSSFTPPQVAQLYNFPTDVTGQGECVAIIELGGGYSQDDLTSYFQQLGVAAPTVISVGVDGADNVPGQDPNGADGEVELDVEVVGAIATGAKIVVYFAPNTDQGFVDAINQAVHDTTNNPSVVSISWGGPESSWSDQALQAMDQAFQAAASLGVTVCAAAGDNGSGDGVTTDNLAHVDFPASDPFVLACGGTLLAGSGNQISSEVVWNESANSATGGGVSDKFDLPTWQQNIGVPPSANAGNRIGRGVPDVAGDADPQSGYQIRVDGQDTIIGGTSAVAPLWSALVALLNQKRGGQSLGYLNPTLYQNYQALQQDNAFNDITQGNNGVYSAGPGWDACTGLGSPNGSNLATGLASLSGQQVVATEPTPS
jgi:kumamolisin